MGPAAENMFIFALGLWCFLSFTNCFSHKQTVLCFTCLTGHCYWESCTKRVEFVVVPHLICGKILSWFYKLSTNSFFSCAAEEQICIRQKSHVPSAVGGRGLLGSSLWHGQESMGSVWHLKSGLTLDGFELHQLCARELSASWFGFRWCLSLPGANLTPFLSRARTCFALEQLKRNPRVLRSCFHWWIAASVEVFHKSLGNC